MDITFKTEEGVFNYRVSALIIHDNKLLAMQDRNVDGYYLPGGRVKLHESLEDALVREIKEELSIEIKNYKPLFLHQNFFLLESKNEKFHEIGVYFLVDIKDTNLLERGNKFLKEEEHISHVFEWLDIDSLENQIIFPLFVRTKLKNLPNELTLIMDTQ